ncbi:MAG: hypothetical protein ACI32E_03645 [Bacilli bacterium]
MKKVIMAFHHLIVLIWLIIVLVVFKVTTNFKFENGSSLIFIALIVVFPTVIYVYTFINKNKIRKQKKEKMYQYYRKIQDDKNKNQLKSNLLDKIKELGLDYELSEDQEMIRVTIYSISKKLFNLTFTKSVAMLHMVETEIIYYFYYSNQIKEYSKYDLRNFEYKETEMLYSKIIDRINSLIQKTYVYTQSSKQIKLVIQDTNEVVYDLTLNKKLFSNIKKEKKILNLKY